MAALAAKIEGRQVQIRFQRWKIHRKHIPESFSQNFSGKIEWSGCVKCTAAENALGDRNFGNAAEPFRYALGTSLIHEIVAFWIYFHLGTYIYLLKLPEKKLQAKNLKKMKFWTFWDFFGNPVVGIFFIRKISDRVENVRNFIYFKASSYTVTRKMSGFCDISRKTRENRRFLAVFFDFGGFGGVPIKCRCRKFGFSLRTL